MRLCKFNEEQILFLQRNASKYQFAKELATELNRTFSTSYTVSDVKNYIRAHRIRLAPFRREYSQEEVDYLRETLLVKDRDTSLEMFNQRFLPITMPQLKRCMAKYDLYSGKTGKLEPGHQLNQLPVGTEKVWKVKGRSYIGIKVAEPSKWMHKHIYLYEQQYGKVPKDKVIIFLDGDTMNCELDNLSCIEKRINMIMNKKGLPRSSKEETLASIQIARLIASIKDAEKKIEKESRNERIFF